MHLLVALLEDHLVVTTAIVAFVLTLSILALQPWRNGTGGRTLILGSGRLARRLIVELEARGGRGGVLGLVAEEPSAGTTAIGYPVLGGMNDLGAVIARVRPQRIVVAVDQRRGRLPVGALLEARARGITVEDGASAYERLARRLAIDTLSPSALIFSDGFQPRRLERFLGRTASLVLSAIGLVVWAPLFALIALLIRLDTAGPAFFSQERVGLKGRRFHLIKFRTMLAEGAGESLWAGDNAQRITRVGHWLRRFHLDELPQFINVLRGDMNLVGPRPHPVSNVDLFSERIPFYSLRTFVRPGITGWAQVAYGYANNLEEETEKMRYDLYYIKRQSLWLDLRILARTCLIFVTGASTEGRAVDRLPSTPPISRAQHRVA